MKVSIRGQLALAALSLLGALHGPHASAQSAVRAGAKDAFPVDPDCRPTRVRPALPYDHLSLGGLLGCSASSVLPWSVSFSPAGDTAYVSLFGGLFGNGGCLLAKVDVGTRALDGLIQVEESPEEIVFTTFPNGSMRYGWVSCSSESTVVVFDAQDEIVTSIAIPVESGTGWPTAFPFGLAVSEDQSRVYVGTLDGSGRVLALDGRVPALIPSETLHLGTDRTFGRLIVSGDELLLPSTRFHASGQGSTAEVVFVDPDHAAGAVVLPLASADDGTTFPSAQDMALACDGRLFVAGFDMGPQIYVVNRFTRSLARTLPTFTSQSMGKFQALALSSKGLLAVADFFTQEVTLYDVWGERWLGLVDDGAYTGPHSQFSELQFDAAGDQLWVVGHVSQNLAFLGIP